MKNITVVAAESQDILEARGADIEFTFDTVKEAKQRARYYLSEDYRVASEASGCLGYAQVLVNGRCVADYFAQSKTVRGVPCAPHHVTTSQNEGMEWKPAIGTLARTFWEEEERMKRIYFAEHPRRIVNFEVIYGMRGKSKLYRLMLECGHEDYRPYSRKLPKSGIVCCGKCYIEDKERAQ